MKGQDLKREIMKKFKLKDSDRRNWPKEPRQLWDDFQSERSQIVSDFQEKTNIFRKEVIEREDKLVRKFMERLK